MTTVTATKFRETEIGLIPAEWSFGILKDFCEQIQYGFTQSATLDKVGPKFLRITDIQNQQINWNSVPFCKISEADYKKYMLNSEDIVIARTGASTGVNTIYKAGMPDSVFASYLIRVKTNKKLNSFFGYYYLQSQFYKDYVAGILGGSAQPNANAQQLTGVNIPIPEISEQEQIVEVLSSIDNKIELNRQMNDGLEKMASSIFKNQFFTGSKKQSSTWKLGTIAEISNMIHNLLNPADFSEETFDHFSLPAFDEGRVARIELGESIKSQKGIVPRDAVLISKLNPETPRVWLPSINLSRRAICSTEFLVMTPKEGISREFLYCLFRSPNFTYTFSTLVTGTSGSHQRVKPEGLLSTEIRIPPHDLINQFTTTVRPILSLINENIHESSTLSNLRDLLLPRLMNGKIRV